MGLRERLREFVGSTTPVPERLWPSELDPDEDEPPVTEVDHTDDDPGPEHVANGELRSLEPGEE